MHLTESNWRVLRFPYVLTGTPLSKQVYISSFLARCPGLNQRGDCGYSKLMGKNRK